MNKGHTREHLFANFVGGNQRIDEKSVAFECRLLSPPHRDALSTKSKHAERPGLRLVWNGTGQGSTGTEIIANAVSKKGVAEDVKVAQPTTVESRCLSTEFRQSRKGGKELKCTEFPCLGFEEGATGTSAARFCEGCDGSSS